MALQINEQTDSGVTGNYWRIVAIHTNKATGDIGKDYSTCSVALYLDKTSRDANKNPLKVETYRFPSAWKDTPAVKQTDAEWYSYLKTLAKFNGASDV